MPAKIQPAQTKLTYFGELEDLDGKYIDLAQSLSFVNRRAYEQSKCYFLEQIKFIVYYGNGYNPQAGSQVSAALLTIPDTWVTRNAWTKAQAMWREMQDKVLDDNPSVEGKWNNFKVFMDVNHYSGGSTDAGPNLNMLPVNAAGTPISAGEWDMSTFVRPQHEVDPATGEPLAADEFNAHMLGANVGSLAPGSGLNSAGIIQGYEDTRALVVPGPDVPAEMSDSWMTLLSDDGSQEPELAQVIEGEGDNPPYDRTDFIGGDANWTLPIISTYNILSVYSPEDIVTGFCVPLGLLYVGLSEQVSAKINPATGVPFDPSQGNHELQNPQVLIELTLAKGHYKGVACTEMRQ